MTRFLLVGLTTLFIPSSLSADWIHTTWQSSGFGIRYTGVTGPGGSTQTTIGHFVTKYYYGNMPGGLNLNNPPPANGTYYASYCATILEHQSNPDAYNVIKDTIAEHDYYTTPNDALVAKQLSYLVNEGMNWVLDAASGTFVTPNIASAVVQAAVWMVTLPGMALRSMTNDGNSGNDGVYGGTFAQNQLVHNLINDLITQATNYGAIDTNDPYLIGPPVGPGSPNQDIIFAIDGGGGGVVDETAPLPSSMIGAIATLLLVAGFTSRFRGVLA